MEPIDIRQSIFEQYEPESPIATELRRLYHNVRQRKESTHRTRSFMVTSSDRGEGKSTITSYFALTIAQFPKQKVLVVDADMRRPRQHKIFGLENDQGLKECLANGNDPIQTAKKTVLPNLDVLTAGGKTAAPSQLFEADVLAEFFDKIHFYYDIILVDSAPVLAVSDTLFLCPRVDAVLFVVLAGVTPRGVVNRAKKSLDESDANLAGVVVNNTLDVLPYFYGYKYYGYENDPT